MTVSNGLVIYRTANVVGFSARHKRLKMTLSSTALDAYGTRMSIELFDSFLSRSAAGPLGVPEEYRDRVFIDGIWEGGFPYTTISHLVPKSKDAVPAKITNMWRDGAYLKAVATINDNVAGDLLYKRLLSDENFRESLGVSIAFVDIKHQHEDGTVFQRSFPGDICRSCLENGYDGVVFRDGVLFHVAFTKIPANPDTEVVLMSDNLQRDPRVLDAIRVLGLEEDDAGELLDALYHLRMAELGVVLRDDDSEQGDNDNGEVERSEVMKKERDCEHPASHYLYVGDPNKPSTWALPYKDCEGNLDWRRIGAAYAALTVGFRGNKYSGPNKEELLRKVKKLYEEHGKPLPSERDMSLLIDALNAIGEAQPSADDNPLEAAQSEPTVLSEERSDTDPTQDTQPEEFVEDRAITEQDGSRPKIREIFATIDQIYSSLKDAIKIAYANEVDIAHVAVPFLNKLMDTLSSGNLSSTVVAFSLSDPQERIADHSDNPAVDNDVVARIEPIGQNVETILAAIEELRSNVGQVVSDVTEVKGAIESVKEGIGNVGESVGRATDVLEIIEENVHLTGAVVTSRSVSAQSTSGAGQKPTGAYTVEQVARLGVR